MKKFIKLAIIAGFTVAASIATFVHTAPAAVSSSVEGSPRSLYLKNCATCHGSDGRANTARGRKLEAADLTGSDVQGKSLASITRTIKNGRSGMPAFGKRLTAAQIVSLAGYVKSL